jgi:predicted ribosomally synthesized peptide with nif11-like leader
MEKSSELLLKKMLEDKSFAEKLLSQTEREKVIEIAGEEGIALTNENIDEINEIIKEIAAKQSAGELTEEELETVAGGTLSAVISAISFGAATAAAAGASVSLMTVSVSNMITGSMVASMVSGGAVSASVAVSLVSIGEITG